jgi:hypothetical protein
MDSEASYGLVRTLLDVLQCNFATVANSEELFSAEPAPTPQSGKDFTQIIVCGGSNMSKIIPLLKAKGYEVIDLTVVGWTPTEKNIQSLRETLLNTPNRNESAIFLDLLGNVAFRQEQLDGTPAMPYKSDGKYHIEGKVHVCSHQSMSTLIENLKPILDLLDGPFLFASPLPRYLFNGCCLSKDHCVGTDSEDYVKMLLQETLALRKVCKNTLVKLGKKKAWVPDFIGNLLPACNGLLEQAAGLKQVMAADGVHFTRHGYEKIAETVVKVCKTHLEKTDSAASPVSAVPVGSKPKTFYWRGFVSPVGSVRPSAHTAAFKAAHPGGGGKWRSKPVNVGKNSTLPPGGRSAPPYYRRN